MKRNAGTLAGVHTGDLTREKIKIYEASKINL